MTPRRSRITGYGNRFASSSVAGESWGGPCDAATMPATATPISADVSITLIEILCGAPINYHRRTCDVGVAGPAEAGHYQMRNTKCESSREFRTADSFGSVRLK